MYQISSNVCSFAHTWQKACVLMNFVPRTFLVSVRVCLHGSLRQNGQLSLAWCRCFRDGRELFNLVSVRVCLHNSLRHTGQLSLAWCRCLRNGRELFPSYQQTQQYAGLKQGSKHAKVRGIYYSSKASLTSWWFFSEVVLYHYIFRYTFQLLLAGNMEYRLAVM